jgi:hypothetical protein
MATFSKNNFIIPVGVDSNSLRIRDIKGQLKHTILNSSSTTFFNNGANVIIRTQGDSSDIALDFSCVPEAIQALNLLNKEYSKLKMNIATKSKTDLLGTIIGSSHGTDVKPMTHIFSNAIDNNGAITSPIKDNQVSFQLPSTAKSVQAVSVNGVVINDYVFNAATKMLTVDPVFIGYELDSYDELIVSYFA